MWTFEILKKVARGIVALGDQVQPYHQHIVCGCACAYDRHICTSHIWRYGQTQLLVKVHSTYLYIYYCHNSGGEARRHLVNCVMGTSENNEDRYLEHEMLGTTNRADRPLSVEHRNSNAGLSSMSSEC